MCFIIAVVIASLGLPFTAEADQPLLVEQPEDVGIDRSTGVVEGTVTYQADKKQPWRYARYYIKNRRGGELAEAVVALTDRSLKDAAPRKQTLTAVIDQKNFRFDPETVAIQVGDRVKFTNSDTVVHNVRTVNPLHSFNVNLAAGGEHLETFSRASGTLRPYRLGCDYHSSMRAWIFVVSHPYFHVTKADGKFRLRGIPPGEYSLGVIHPAGELKWSQKVSVEAGQATKMDVRLSPRDKLDANE